MINSPLCRSALAAAIAVLSLPAAAQDDAALSIALGAMHAPLAAMARLKTQPQIPAAAQAQVSGPTAPADVWKKLVDTLREDGEYEATMPYFLLWNRGAIGELKPRQETYMIKAALVWPETDTADPSKFALHGIEFDYVDQTRFPAENLVRSELWVFVTDANGRLDEATRRPFTTRDGSKPAGGAVETLNLNDPKTRTKFDAMLKFWSTR